MVKQYQKFGTSMICGSKKLILYTANFKKIKVTVKTFIQTISISNECSPLKKCIKVFTKYESAQMFSTLIIKNK